MKRVFAAMLALLIAYSAIFIRVPLTASAESLYIRKIVSIVYDDSGSMKDMGSANWAYASYAMQAFCGLLNSDDQLYITYMSEAAINPYLDPSGVDLSAGSVQSSVDAIRNHIAAGNTPYSAIDIAFDKLSSVQDPNVNTQYWLVVITDGEFQDTLGYGVPVDDLNDKLSAFAETAMPNGSMPQITYLAIGNNAAKPNNEPSRGIYAYESVGAKDIVNVMSQIADKISGRSRLDAGDMSKKGSDTIEIKSSVPLLNIAVLSQNTNAKITDVSYNGEEKLEVSRSVAISYPEYPGWTTDTSLKGRAFLINNPSGNIGSGTYSLKFSDDVDLDDIVVMFEPALEMRMKVFINGDEIDDHRQLQNVHEGDNVDISCKIYEMGTDTEVDPALLPPNTQFEIYISEDKKVVKQSSGKDMLLSDYELQRLETELKSSLIIPGFNPIEYSVKFTPKEYIPEVVYTVTAEHGSDVKSVKYDNISANRDLSICFTVYADGVAITDPSEVKALAPNIAVSPQGNDGTVTYTDDGKIVFVPNTASEAAPGVESFKVEVSCTLNDGTSASESYTVLIAEYDIVAIGAAERVKKTEFFNNRIGVSFYITKDGVKLDKAAVEQDIDVLLNESHSNLKMGIDIADDGTISVTPYSDEEYELTFLTWWGNWVHYLFGLEGDDITVTLQHVYGTADAVIDVCGEDTRYILLNVVLPLAIEAAVLLYLIWWIYAVAAKPKFLSDATLYIGYLEHGGTAGNWYHEISMLEEVSLQQYNKLKYRWKPTLKSKVVFVGKDLYISAGYNGSILCHSQVWYKGEIKPRPPIYVELDHPKKIKDYLLEHDSFKIKVLSPCLTEDVQPIETLDRPDDELYYVHTNLANMEKKGGIDTIESGTIFAYVIHTEP